MTNCLINIHYLETTCRICLKDKSKEEMKTLMSGCLHDLFTQFTNLELSENDNLPYKLCMVCTERLKNSVEFREQCIKSDEFLKAQKIFKAETEEDTTENIQSNNETDAYVNDFLEIDYVCKSDTSNSKDKNRIDNSTTENIKEFKKNVKRIQSKKRKKQNSGKNLKRNQKKKLNTESLVVGEKSVDYNLNLSCPICGEDFQKADRLEAHYRVHLGKKPEVCHICGKEFSKLPYLESHLEFHDPVCKLCGKRLCSKSSLRTHEKLHTGIGCVVCHACGKLFQSNNSLKTHVIRMHCDEKPFACEKCPKAFKMATELKEHMLRHFGIKKFICTVCGAAKVSKAGIAKHMAAAHSDEKRFQCKLCPKRYKLPGQLKIHSRSHTGERPYKCDLCPKSFKTREVHKNHRMLHTGEKPYSCNRCGRAFTQKVALTSHMKMHTKIGALDK